MFKLYHKSQEVQLNWIRNHPIQWITLNVVLIVAWIGYLEYKDRKEFRDSVENHIDPENPLS